MTLIVEGSARSLSPAELHPAGDCPGCGGSLGMRRLMAPGGLEQVARALNSRRDASELLEQLIRDTWLDLQVERRIRNRSHRELSDYAAFDRVAVARRGVLRDLFAIRRALKGAHR